MIECRGWHLRRGDRVDVLRVQRLARVFENDPGLALLRDQRFLVMLGSAAQDVFDLVDP